MIEAEFITRFCELINRGLMEGQDWTIQAQQDLKDYTQHSPLLTQLSETFAMALRPQKFSLYSVEDVNADFHQAYELLYTTFDNSVLGPKVDHRTALLARKNRTEPSTALRLARYWEVLGLHRYDAGGQLKVFHYDRLASTRQIASVISAGYMPLIRHQGEGIVGIGHLATIERHRRRGHGRALTLEIEAQMHKIASARAEKLRVVLLESEREARPFWFSLGYRWPRGAVYYQPPLEFDSITGKPSRPPVPEMLMVKVIGSDSTHIDRNLLLDAVYTLYKRWYVPDTESDAAAQEASDYVFGTLFAKFETSLPSTGTMIPLDAPPS